MAEDSSLKPQISSEKQEDSTSTRELDLLILPKQRSNPSNAGSSTSLTSDLTDSDQSSKDDSLNPKSPSSSSNTSADEHDKKNSSQLIVVKRRPGTIDLSSPKDAIFTSPSDLSGANTPDTSASKALIPFTMRGNTYDLSTPTKRRAISYGKVQDTPSSSTDRYIPTRGRDDTSIINFRTNRRLSQLSPEQRQMRLDGSTPDPFMARRVTPQFRINRTLGIGINPPMRSSSASSVWNFGGSATHQGPMARIHDGKGNMLGSGTNARIFSSDFFEHETAKESHERYEGRLAKALELDRAGKVLDFSCETKIQTRTLMSKGATEWKDGQWIPPKIDTVLDAPDLRDDYYCTLLAYCPVARALAVALNNRVFLWSEPQGVRLQARPDPEGIDCHVTSLSFSSPGSSRSILAIGRSDGRVNLWDVKEDKHRIQHAQPKAVACLAFKPVPTRRFSDFTNETASTEELLVGDDGGSVYYYSVEWPELSERTKPTAMILLAIFSLHKQQVCGLAWSPDGNYFASGGNDNVCYLMSLEDIPGAQKVQTTARAPLPHTLSPRAPIFVPQQGTTYTINTRHAPYEYEMGGFSQSIDHQAPFHSWAVRIGADHAKHRWQHAAAVKAIAFCPWQKGLVATGGGINDRAIHFFHTGSGATLATIEVHAQVTSLIWSKTKREICATFGYSNPNHPFRIAVFSWPDCRQVVRIPWKDNLRALYAIPYPGGPNEEVENAHGNGKVKAKAKTKHSEGGIWWSRTTEEGCIVIASSDQSVKFHEVWSGHSTGMGARTGGLAWSSILESEEGGDIDFLNAQVIR